MDDIYTSKVLDEIKKCNDKVGDIFKEMSDKALEGSLESSEINRYRFEIMCVLGEHFPNISKGIFLQHNNIL